MTTTPKPKTLPASMRTMMENAGLSPAVCSQCGRHHWPKENVEALFLAMLEELAAGKSVTLRGLGTLSTRRSPGRVVVNVRNPSEVFEYEDAQTIVFSPAKSAKTRVNNGQRATTKRKKGE